jgi:hypothetical protein
MKSVSEISSLPAQRAPTRRDGYWVSTSPLWAYGLSFVAVLLVYGLGWSEMFSPLSWPLIGFILTTCAVCFLIAGLEWMTWRPAILHIATWWTPPRVKRSVYALYGLIILECLHAGGIPLWLVLSGGEYDYTKFGIPTLHVFVLGAYAFLTVHWFNLWTKYGVRLYLVSASLLAVISLVIVNRGAFFQVLLSIGVLYLAKVGIRLRSLALGAVGLGLVTVVFGILGDARMVAGGIDPQSTIFVLGDASESYPIDQLGSGPFWLYLYAASPLANWELNISRMTTIYIEPQIFAAIELLPDFITKRLLPESPSSMHPALVTDVLSVLGAYGRAFFYGGWVGCVAVFLLFLTYYLVIRFVFRRTEYLPSVMATLASGAALMTYFNMLTFSGLIAPLLIAIVLRATATFAGAKPRPAAAAMPHTPG